jgi:hypothetical protein
VTINLVYSSDTSVSGGRTSQRLTAQDHSLNGLYFCTAFSFCKAGFYWTGSDNIVSSFAIIIDVVLQNNTNYCYYIELDWEIMDIRCH